MKKLALVALLAGSIAFVSCGGDDAKKFEILLDGDAITDMGVYYDEWGGRYYGNQTRSEGVATHNRYPIMFTNGTYPEESCWPDGGYTNHFILELFSPVGEEIEMGEYTINYYGANGNMTGLKFGNVWGVYIESETRSYTDAEGTVTLSGSFPNNIRMDFDMKMYYYEGPVRSEGGTPSTFVELTGTYKGAVLFRENCD